MATGEMEVDSRVTCNVCLEPFRGRHPKILPCFHTFCLPCLTRLVEGETSGAGSTDDEGRPCARLTCPTCRRVTPVPPGGAVEFQANFYVEDSSRQSSTQPPPCNLCDGVHDASYQCHKCQRNLCAECRCYHDKLCMGSQVTELQQASSFSSSSMGVEGASHSTVKQQLQKVEDVMKKLTEEEKEVNQERRLVESDIYDRYATLLRHVNEARDVCLTSLRETCQGVTDRLQSHMTRAKQAQDTLTQQLSCPQPAPISVPQLNTALFLGGDLQTVLNTDSDRKGSVLHQEMKDNTEMLVSCIQSFIGRVVESGQAATGVQSKSSAPELGILGNRGSSASAEPSLISAGGGDLQSMQQRLDDVANQVKQLSLLYSLLSDSSSSKISTVEKELAAMKDKMASDQTTVLRELTALQEKNTKLMADQAVVQREVKTLRDKNTIALQDLSVMSSEKDQLHAEVSKLQQDIISMQTDSSMLQTDVIQLKTDRDSVMTDVKTALNDITALQGDVNTAKNDIKKVEAGQATVKSDMNTFQSDVKALQGDITTAKNDLTTLKTDHSSLRSDVSSAQKDITALQGDSSTLKSDVKSSKSQLTSLQQSVRSAQDSLRDRTSKITALETCLKKASSQVSFHAILKEEVTTTKQQTLICDCIITNVGSDYSGQTGVFTAPVAGTYCFMVTAGTCKADSEKKARLDIVLENVRKGYMRSIGNCWSTGHTVIKVSAGQKVWLRTFGDGEYTFSAGWWTTFSGMLLQPDF